MREELKIKIYQVSFGIIIGIISFAFSEEKDFDTFIRSVLFGLVGIIAFTNFTIQHKHEELDSRFTLILNEFAAIAIEKSFLSSLLMYGAIRIEKSETPKVWEELLWSTKERYWATTYTRPEEVFLQDSFQRAFSIQHAKKKASSVEFKLIYILDDISELNKFEAAIKSQFKSNFQIRYIEKDLIESTPLLRDKIKKLTSPDIGISDSQCLWRLDLDEERQINYGEVIFDKEIIKKHLDIYKELYEASKVPSFSE